MFSLINAFLMVDNDDGDAEEFLQQDKLAITTTATSNITAVAAINSTTISEGTHQHFFHQPEEEQARIRLIYIALMANDSLP